MKFIQGHNRTQINLFPVLLDQSIDPENEVRIIDLFVESLSIKDYGFRMDFTENCRPAYHPADLLKLFIYGYLNMVRFSRDLEKECHRNIEVMWLLKCIKPDHNTISNFRRDNPNKVEAKAKVKRLSTILSTSTSRLRLSDYHTQPQPQQNLRRIGNILTRDLLKEYLRILVSMFLNNICLSRLINSHFINTFFRIPIWI